MAFTGVAVIKQVADNLVRITGVAVPSEGGTGTIGLFEKTVAPDVRLPEGFKPEQYSRPGASDVTLQDSIQVEVNFTNQGATAVAIDIDKTGTTPEDFAITITNNAAVEGGSTGDLEIYVRFH